MMFFIWYSLVVFAIGSGIGYLLDRMSARARRKEQEQMAIMYLKKLEDSYGKVIKRD
jgi:deoxyadenosine/deoxycytidine kinase